MTKKEQFARMSCSLERMEEILGRIAKTIEKQQPGRFRQALAIGESVAGTLGMVSFIEIVRKWIVGG